MYNINGNLELAQQLVRDRHARMHRDADRSRLFRERKRIREHRSQR